MSTTTKTYFCYGVPVTNESITYATMASEHLDGPFRFIRLVQKRIREGSLRTSQPSAIGALPNELWDLVRHKVTDLELRAAEHEFLKRVRHDPPLPCRCTPSAKQWASLLRCTGCLNKLLAYQGFCDAALAEVRRGRRYRTHMSSNHLFLCRNAVSSYMITVSICLRPGCSDIPRRISAL